MKQVTIENVKARVAALETREQIGGRLPMVPEFELACLRQLLDSMGQKPFMYGIADPDGNPHMDEMCVGPTLSPVQDAVSCLNENDTEDGEQLYQVVPLYRNPVASVPEVYNIGDATMRHIFMSTGMTNVSDMQAVFDRVEIVLTTMDSEPVAWLLSGGGAKNVVCFDSGNAYADPLREVTPLYRRAAMLNQK